MRKTLRTLDLFSGIGGFSLAFAKFARTIGFCDNEPAARAVLERKMKAGRLDKAPVFEDVRTLHPEDLPPSKQNEDLVDLITAGFPCQDISVAGLRAGLVKGARSSLVQQVIRLVHELGGQKPKGGTGESPNRRQRRIFPFGSAAKNKHIPSYVFLENVSGIVSQEAEYKTLLTSLDEAGYDSFYDYFSAAGSGAVHKRVRWFLLAVRRDPHPVPIDAVRDLTLERRVSKGPFSFRQSAILPTGSPSDRFAAGRQQAKISMEMLANAVVPAQANRAFRSLLRRAEALRSQSSLCPSMSSMPSKQKLIPVPGAQCDGVIQKLEADPTNVDPVAASKGAFTYNIKPLGKGEKKFNNQTELRRGAFRMNYLGTPRRHHAKASAPTARAFADFGTGVAYCKTFARGVNPRGAIVKHTFAEVAMGFPPNWTRDPVIFAAKREKKRV
jgi:site-specific DNA-cytosine methylase